MDQHTYLNISSANIRWLTTIFPTVHSTPIEHSCFERLQTQTVNKKWKWPQNSPMPYLVGYSKEGWQVSAPFHLHGLVSTPNHQQSYCAHRYTALNYCSSANSRLWFVLSNAFQTHLRMLKTLGYLCSRNVRHSLFEQNYALVSAILELKTKVVVCGDHQ